MSNKTVNIVSKMISDAPSNNYVELYDSIKMQNDILKNNINNLKEMFSTDNQNINYQYAKIKNYKYFNYILLIIYFITLGISFIFLIRSKKIKQWYVKLIIVIVFVLYPFFIYYLENYLYEFFSYTFSIINGEKYKKTTIPVITNTKIQL